MTEPTSQTTAAIELGLDFLSLAALKRVSRTLNLPVLAAGRDGFVKKLAGFLGTPKHREILEKRLSPRDWSTIDLLPLRVGHFHLHAFVAALRDRGFSPSDALAQIERLLSLGCVLPVSGLFGENRVSIDQPTLRREAANLWLEITPGVAEWAHERTQPPLSLDAVDPPGTPVEASHAELQRATFILLSEAERKPIRLTTKGAPYKAELTRLASALAGGSSGSGRGTKRGSSSPTSSPILWFALGALVGARLLGVKGQDLEPAADAIAFLGSPIDQQMRRLLVGWLNGPFDDFARVPTLITRDDAEQNGSSGDPWFTDDDVEAVDLDSVIHARATVVEALRLVTAPSPGAWYSIDEFASLVYRQDRELLFPRYSDYELLSELSYKEELRGGLNPQPYFGVYRVSDGKDDERSVLYLGRDWQEVEGAFVRQVLVESLRWLGLVDVGPSDGSPDRFRITRLGQYVFRGHPVPADDREQASRLIVQPNYDVVVVDALANVSLLAQLDGFAERRSLDRAATFRLTQAELIRGLDHGWTEQRIFKLLEDASDRPLPQNVAFTLHEWIALYRRLTVRERPTLLEADNPAQLDGWLADREISPMLGPQLGPTSVLVASTHTERLLGTLAARRVRCDVIDYREKRTDILQVRDPDVVELAAQHAEPYLVYRLEGLAELVENDRRKSVYRLSRESVARAVQNGWQGPAMLDFLAGAAGRPLPDDFFTRLVGWSGTTSPLGYEPLVAVQLPSPVLKWEILQRIPPVGRLIRAVPLPGLALVAPDDLEVLRTELSERGIELKPAAIASSDLEPNESANPLQAALTRLLRDPLALLQAEFRPMEGAPLLLGRPGQRTPRR